MSHFAMKAVHFKIYWTTVSFWWNLAWNFFPSAACNPLWRQINLSNHTHDLPHHALKQARLAARISELSEQQLLRRTAQPGRAETGRRGERGKQTGRRKSGHLDQRAAGSHGWVTDGMVHSCSVSVLSASRSYESTPKWLGMRDDWVQSRIIQSGEGFSTSLLFVLRQLWFQ